MSQLGEGVKPPASGRHNPTCPFCEGDQGRATRGYHTKHGALKDEKELGKSLAETATVTSDKKVGTVFPFPGGADDHQGWAVDKNVLEDVKVTVRPTPHHLIPGNAAMAKSPVEKWTLEKKGKIKEDVGYSIDCTRNGIWLPHLPHVYWTSYKTATKRWCDVYGKWSELDPADQDFVGKVVMGETSLQMHYTDHDDPYIDTPHLTTYDGESKKRCDLLGELMADFWVKKCPDSKSKADGKIPPPYGVVERLNLQSDFMRKRITGHPSRWKSFVSPLAQTFAKAVRGRRIKIVRKNVVARI